MARRAWMYRFEELGMRPLFAQMDRPTSIPPSDAREARWWTCLVEVPGRHSDRWQYLTEGTGGGGRVLLYRASFPGQGVDAVVRWQRPQSPYGADEPLRGTAQHCSPGFRS